MADIKRLDKAARQLKLLSDALNSGRLGPVRRMVNTLSPAEIGNLLESLPSSKRLVVWGLVDSEDDGEVLLHVGDEVREGLLRDMDPEEMVAAAESLEIDDLAELLEDLPQTVTEQLLQAMDRENRERLEQVLSYSEDTAGRLMDPDVITVRADVSVDVVLRYLRLRGEIPETTDYLFVVNRHHQHIGRLGLSALLTADPDTPVNELIDDEQSAIDVDTQMTEVAQQFEDHDWVTAPVVDKNHVLVGRITIDDVVDIIREQAEHSVKSMAGLSDDEDLFSPVPRAAKRRAVWLGINLLTALLASAVIGQFEATLTQVVALAVLMPIVASMGGIAGTQTLTLMVRGIALGQVGGGNSSALLNKEVRVAIFNGFAWAIVVGLVAFAWFQDGMLAFVLGAAMVINLVVAAFSGVVVPLTLRRFAIDPALAGGVILTTITDVIGFLAFLGLGTLLLIK